MTGPSVAVVVTSSTPLWYMTRATGLVALVLLTAGMCAGLLTSVRFEAPSWPRFVTLGLHRNLSLLALALSAGPLVGLRVLAGRGRARPRHGHRHPGVVGARADRLVLAAGCRADAVAAR